MELGRIGFIVTILLLIIACDGGKGKTSDIGLDLNGPIDVTLLNNYLIVLNTNYNQVNKTGSLLVIDPKTNQKVASIKVPSISLTMLALKKSQKVLVASLDQRSILLFDFKDPRHPVLEHTFEFDPDKKNRNGSPFNMEADDSENRVFVTTKATNPAFGDNSLLYEIDIKKQTQPKFYGTLALPTEVMHYIPEKNAILFLPTSYGLSPSIQTDRAKMTSTLARNFKYFIYELAAFKNSDYKPISGFASVQSKDANAAVYGNFVSKYFIEPQDANTNNDSPAVVSSDQNETLNANNNGNDNSNNNNTSTVPYQPLQSDQPGFLTVSRGNGTVFLVSGFEDLKKITFSIVYAVNAKVLVEKDNMNPISTIYFKDNDQEILGLVNWVPRDDVQNRVQSTFSVKNLTNPGTAGMAVYGPVEGGGSIKGVWVADRFYVLNFFVSSIFVLDFRDGNLIFEQTIE